MDWDREREKEGGEEGVRVEVKVNDWVGGKEGGEVGEMAVV